MQFEPPKRSAAHQALIQEAEKPRSREIFADDFVHPQGLCGHAIAPQRGDVGVAPVPGQQAQHQGAEHVVFVWCVAAAVDQGQADTQL
jgi:hypothetical protein